MRPPVKNIFGGNFFYGKWVIRKFHHRRFWNRRAEHEDFETLFFKIYFGDFKNIFPKFISGISKICKHENKNLFNGARKGEYEKFKPKKNFKIENYFRRNQKTFLKNFISNFKNHRKNFKLFKKF